MPRNQQPDVTKTILIVDDEQYVRQSFYDHFEDQGWQVYMAESGEVALKFLQTRSCSAAIVDIRMGGMDGETFIQLANQKYPKMVFVICTGSPEYDVSEALIQNKSVSAQIFKKPVSNLYALENFVLKLIADKAI